MHRLGFFAVALVMLLAAGCSNDREPDARATGAAPYPTTTDVAEEPSAAASPSGGGLATQPFDGGEYTWTSTGVTMRTSVVKVEPWGDRDDFCGDGSCGVADPDDTRFVLKYEVTVPRSYSGPLDTSGCPGTLHVESGNDDEAFSGVAGDYARPIGDSIFPGNTKFGVDEYYVEKAYVSQTFYLESTCGAPGSVETVYFRGTLQ